MASAQRYQSGTPNSKPNGQSMYNNQIHDTIQNPLMDSNLAQPQQIEMQNINIQNEEEHHAPDSEREDDLKNLIGILLGKVQLKRMEPALLLKLQNMEQFYDLLPFNIRGFKLVNRASLLEANFTKKYILKQTQDLNLDLNKGQFEKHYLVDAAIKVVKNTPCWSFFMTLILLMVFLLHVILDPILMDLMAETQPNLNDQIDALKNVAHTSRDDQNQTDMENETLAISFLLPLLAFRLLLWFSDLLIRFIGLHFFRKKYILWTLLLDFIMVIITVIIGGFCTRLDQSISDYNQSRVEILLRNFIIFVLFIVAMIQGRKALGVIKRLGLLYTQTEKPCCNFSAF